MLSPCLARDFAEAAGRASSVVEDSRMTKARWMVLAVVVVAPGAVAGEPGL